MNIQHLDDIPLISNFLIGTKFVDYKYDCQRKASKN